LEEKSVLRTALAQLHHGFSLVFGRRLRVANIERLVADIVATRAEFGGIGDLEEFRGTSMSIQDRKPIDDRRLRRIARMAYAETSYYRDLFDRVGMRPDEVNLSTLERLPVTRKETLRDTPEALVNRGVRPWYRAETSGTTGPPSSVWFSRYEAEMLTAMTAVSLLIDNGLGEGDVIQLNLVSRAFFGIHCFAGAAALIGVVPCSLGLVEPEISLSRLAGDARLSDAEARPVLLVTYSSYLGLLVEVGERLGYTAADFGLRQIMCGGEVLTEGLRRRAERLFGATVVETYGMTEITPASGQICTGGHLHFHPEQGITEVLDLTGTRAAEPGELGVLTFTPVFPYRETTLLLRLFSGDVVRRLADDDLGCELAQLPATSRVLGKDGHLYSFAGRTVTPRDVLELVEADPAARFPSRWSLQTGTDGLELHILGDDPQASDRIRKRGLEQEIPLARVIVHGERATMPPTAPVRADLRELSFPGATLKKHSETVQ
jgi:phenylacetate-coenzyme A ligase PaaK-like adenylate-forming protein